MYTDPCWKRLIVIESIDNGGKGWQTTEFIEYLTSRDIQVRLDCEPTDMEWGVKIREALRNPKLMPKDPLEFQSWYDRDRADHVRVMHQWFRDNPHGVIVCDRYFYSTRAYGEANGVLPDHLKRLVDWTPRPLIAVFLDVDPITAEEWFQGSGKQREAFEDVELQKRVHGAYRRLIDEYPEFVLLDGISTRENVQRRIRELVMPKLREVLAYH